MCLVGLKNLTGQYIYKFAFIKKKSKFGQTFVKTVVIDKDATTTMHVSFELKAVSTYFYRVLRKQQIDFSTYNKIRLRSDKTSKIKTHS